MIVFVSIENKGTLFDLSEHLSGEVTWIFFLGYLAMIDFIPMVYLNYIKFIGLLALKNRLCFRVVLVYAPYLETHASQCAAHL